MSKAPLRRYFIIVAGFLAFTALFWRRLLFAGLVPFDLDTLCFYLPNWTIGRRLLESKALLWEPFRNFGMPYLAVPQNQGLYPLRFLSGLFSFAGYTRLSVVFHTALAALFSFRLARRRGASDAGAMVAALSLAFAGPFFMRVVFAADFATIAWLPCTLYLLEARRPLWMGLALALQWFAGYPPLFLVGVAVLVCFAAAAEDRPHAWRTLAGALVLAGALSAAQSIPFLELLRRSARTVLLDPAEAIINSTQPIDLARGLLLPSVLHDVFPRALFYRPMFYLGPFVTALAVLAAARGGRNDRRLLAGAIVFFFLALGPYNGVSGRVALLHVFRYQWNWVLGGAACLAVLAARGLSRVQPVRVQWMLAGLVAVDLLAFAWPLRHAAGDEKFLTRLETRLPGFEMRPDGRVMHTEEILRVYPGWDWTQADAWPLLKITLLPSYGTIYGIRESASHHNLTPRSTLELREQLNNANGDPALFVLADIERLVRLKAPGRNAPLPRPEDFDVLRIHGRLGRAFVLGTSTRTAYVALDEPGRMAAVAPGPGTLVFSESNAPGWQATVDGVDTPVSTFRSALMSVPLGEGEHEIIFAYRPESFRWGVAVSVAAGLLALFLAFLRRKRRKNRLPPAATAA